MAEHCFADRCFSDWPPPLNHADQQDGDRDDKQNVDVPVESVGSDHSEKPHHQQNHEDCHQHRQGPTKLYSNRRAKTILTIHRETIEHQLDLTCMEERLQ